MNLEKNKVKFKYKRNAFLQNLYEKGYFDDDILTIAIAEPYQSLSYAEI